MKFSTRTELRVPADDVFRAITDMARLERQLLRKGVEIEGPKDVDVLGTGQIWRAKFHYRGKKRKIEAAIEDLSRPKRIVIESQVDGLENRCEIDLIALSQTKTRFRMAVELRPKTLSARIFLQSLKLVKQRANKRFTARVRTYLFDVERAYGARNE
ncbi:MAG: SRPBCC family protein [Paracoccaceae bacterium]|nr:SRPBCC family protein [Paracoccaceae bacterium]